MGKVNKIAFKLIVVLLLVTCSWANAQLLLFDNDLIQQDSPGLDDSRQLDAQFGFSLSSNRNRLVIGAPRALVNGNKAGAVYVLPAGWSGVFHFSDSIKKYSQDTPGIPGVSETGDNFGYSVAIGMFGAVSRPCSRTDDCLGYLDVIAGVPTESLSGDDNAGMANMIFPGNEDCDVNDPNNCGLLNEPLNQLYQSNGLDGSSEQNDLFGAALAVGDFNDDGIDDLAIGAPGEAVNSNLATGAGAVNVVMGRSGVGLDIFNDSLLSQSILPGGARDDENFGFSLAVGDYDGDGVDDLAIGVPYDVQTAGTNRNGGAINVVYGTSGTSGGLSISGAQLIHQDTDSVVGASEDNDEFGYALASGNFNGDAYDDLAIGVPGEDIGNISNAGAVVILYGSSSGLKTTGTHSIHEDTSFVNGASEAGDRFGSALTTGDFNDDGVDDLAVGTPYEDVSTVADAGRVSMFFGVQGGRLNDVNNDYLIAQGSLGNPGYVSAGVRFGHSLTTGDFDLDGKDDLAIGTAGNMVSTGSINGSVAVIYQREFIDLIFENGFDD
jgi:hypothetical protein